MSDFVWLRVLDKFRTFDRVKIGEELDKVRTKFMVMEMGQLNKTGSNQAR